ncbi:DUF1120 domain-containing protein [Pseudomonas sp. R5-89-07]|uniref:DUF1120 domain-containing protein n=1 Tax=Pseudomonas sp. R5-89-07 TaxID=658644 RepID=UPI000F587260|nr:DUF1120 domain-containing protein [Pseudomonas sp. R5-89-07]AZF03884.1 Beta-fimbriae probable major subunit [Pseudomonas sp. R5-89-07]
MDTSTPYLLAPLLLACALQATAASSAQLAVQGAITPSACLPTLTHDGNIDHGKITAKDLDPEKPTALKQGELGLQVVCEGPTFFALSTIDNRAGSSAMNVAHHGLGVINGNERVGSAAFGLMNAVADDSVAVRTILSSDAGVSWHEAMVLGHGTLTAFALKDGLPRPIALTKVSAELRVYTTIVGASQLTLTDEVPIDGHATLEMKYL